MSPEFLFYSSSDDENKEGEHVDSNDPEEMFQNIQYQKEIISNIRTRPWPMRRKLKVLKYNKIIIIVIMIIIIIIIYVNTTSDMFCISKLNSSSLLEIRIGKFYYFFIYLLK